MTYRVSTFAVRKANNQIAEVRGEELDIVTLFRGAIPIFETEEKAASFLARLATSPSREKLVLRYDAVVKIREAAEKRGAKLWLDPVCEFDGTVVANSGICGEPRIVANKALAM